jgi:hypothetical protein
MQPFKSPSLLEEQEIDEHFRPILVRPMEHQAAALRRFRRTNRIGIAAIILFLPAGIIAALVTRGTSMTPWIPLLVCAACGITFLIAAFRIRAFRCPAAASGSRLLIRRLRIRPGDVVCIVGSSHVPNHSLQPTTGRPDAQ